MNVLMESSQSEIAAVSRALAHLEKEGAGIPIPVEPLPDTVTENGALAYSTTGNPALDLFALAVRDSPEPVVLELFRKAWNQDPRQAVALAMNLRDIRNGKGERTIFWFIALWLRAHKPGTYLSNLKTFVDLGYFKDLCQIVKFAYERKLDRLGENTFVELEYFAEFLRSDMQAVNSNKRETLEGSSKGTPEGKRPSLTLAAKWAPTERTFFDKKENGNQAHVLAKLLFPESKAPQREYRQQLSSLRETLKVVERLMSEDRWSEINFGHVPAKAHRLLRGSFESHQSERYKKYLADLLAGKEKINVTGTQPHELVSGYLKGEALNETIEAQWTTMIANLKEQGVLSHALAIVDVSGSMSGLPMQVAISLGLVVAELTSEPFQGTVVTFSMTPEIHHATGDSLREKVNNVKGMHWEMNTDLLQVFNLLLERMKSGEHAPEEMIKTLFIFTDMQFDEALRDPSRKKAKAWEATYKHIQKKYKREGYAVPNIVFWNLRASHAAFPVTGDVPGVALISGFSTELLKVFMNGDDFTPEEIMKQTIAPYLEKVVIYPKDI